MMDADGGALFPVDPRNLNLRLESEKRLLTIQRSESQRGRIAVSVLSRFDSTLSEISAKLPAIVAAIRQTEHFPMK